MAADITAGGGWSVGGGRWVAGRQAAGDVWLGGGRLGGGRRAAVVCGGKKVGVVALEQCGYIR